MSKKDKEQKLVIYTAPNGEVDLKVHTKDETILATLNQLADIFGVQKAAVSKHLKNIYNTGELDPLATVSKMETVQKEGNREVKRDIEYYNLDAIIAVGYRVNSKHATQFRIWATKTLKQYITKGFTINPHTIQKNYEAFLSAVEDVKKLSAGNDVIKSDSILELVKTFAGTWFSLESYDEDKLPQKGFTKKEVTVHAKDLYKDIAILKSGLINNNQATELFAQEKTQSSLEGILGNVLQSAFGRDVYDSVEEKAVHLLYFVVKNHPFTDGNKRTGAFCFVWFLNKVGIKYNNKITPEALTAITLLVAESDPKDMKRVIGLLLLMLKS